MKGPLNNQVGECRIINASQDTTFSNAAPGQAKFS